MKGGGFTITYIRDQYLKHLLKSNDHTNSDCMSPLELGASLVRLEHIVMQLLIFRIFVVVIVKFDIVPTGAAAM